MRKRIQSIFLVLCMVFTMLPASAMAEEVYTTSDSSKEIIEFTPPGNDQKEKSFVMGTSFEDLDLPGTLTAKVCIGGEVSHDASPIIVTGSALAVLPTVEEVDVPVTWDSTDYNKDIPGNYVFTPVVGVGYTVKEGVEVPQITITVVNVTESYGLWVGGVEVTSENKNGITGEGISGNITYDPVEYTLTIRGKIDNTYKDSNGNMYGIYAMGNLRIKTEKPEVHHSNVIGPYNLDNKSMGDSVGIYVTGDLTILGDEFLWVYSGEASNGSSYGIKVDGNLTLDGGEVSINGDTASQNNSAIFLSGKKSLLTVCNNSYLNGYGGRNVNHSSGIVLSGSESKVIIDNSRVSVSSGHSAKESYGIETYGSVYVNNNANLSSRGFSATTKSYGIYANDITIINSVVDSGSGEADQTSYGIYSTSANSIKITASTVTVSSGNSQVSHTMNQLPDLSDNKHFITTRTPENVNKDVTEENIEDIINNYRNILIKHTQLYKAIIEGGSYTMTQTVANTENDVKAELARQINNLTGIRGTGITVAEEAITVSSFTEAVAGTSANAEGTNGSFTFIVVLGNGKVTDTTRSLTGSIIPTVYTGLTDVQAVEAAKAAIVEGTVTVDFGVDQTAKTMEVQSYVNNFLIGDATGVTANVTHISDNTYMVELFKGSIIDNKSITMTINERANPDIIPVNTAKTLIEDGSYTMTQVVANTKDGVKAELANQINGLLGLSDTGITVAEEAITVSSFTEAVAGTSANEKGTNGSFTFTVVLGKGKVTDTTRSLTGSITATVYTPTVPPIQPPVQPPMQPPTTIPAPTLTPVPKVSMKITINNIQVEVELTSDVIDYYDGQITLPITSDEILNELEKEELSGIQVGIHIPEQKDDSDQQKLNLILKSEVIQRAKDNNKNIIVDVKDSKNKVLYSWSFNKKELTNSDKEINDVNLSLKVESSQLVDEQKDYKDVIPLIVDFAHNGLLPAQASVRIYVGNMKGITPNTKVYLYHYNENIGKLETIPYGYQTTVDKDGYITINILHCSDYVIYTKEAGANMYVSLRKQIKVTKAMINLSLAEGESSKIAVKLPVTLERVKSIDEPTSQSAIGGVTIAFTSSDNKIATVDSEGNITAKAPGEVVIKTTITLYSNKVKKIETRVKVKP